MALFQKGQRTRTSGQGRPKGVPNKVTKALKDMILEALDMAGGAEYLNRQAAKTPAAFLVLVGKVLPLQVTGADNGPLIVKVVSYKDQLQIINDATEAAAKSETTDN